MSHIFLIGFMGAGKSTVGRALAERLDMPFVDLDDHVEASTGLTVGELFETQGEPAFRNHESAALLAVADAPPSVVACGGGVILSDENRRVLKESGCVLYLAVSADVAMARIGGAETRPLLAGGGGETAAALLDARRSTYESVADATVNTTGLTPIAVADRLERAVTACGRCADG